jgi:hypothetical protein
MGQLIQNPSSVPVSVAADWETLLNVNSAGNVGFNAISLTNWDAGTLAPAIAAGSMIEINGSIAYFQNQEAISGGQAGAVCYLWFTVTGTNVSASWDATVPAWNPAKNGWYSGISRSSGHYCYQTGGAYSFKETLKPYGDLSPYYKRVSFTFTGGGITVPHTIPNGYTNIYDLRYTYKITSLTRAYPNDYLNYAQAYYWDNTNVVINGNHDSGWLGSLHIWYKLF